MRSLLLILLIGFFTASRSFSIESQLGDIEWRIRAAEDGEGNWWNTFDFATFPGVRYDIQKNANLEDPWTTVASYYGSGADILYPLFPGKEPAETLGGESPVLPPTGSVSPNFASTVMQLTDDGQVVLFWQSLDTSSPVYHVLSGVTLDPVWDEYESSYFNGHGGYLIGINPLLHQRIPLPSAQPTLGTADQTFISSFIAALPAITQNIVDDVEAATVATPPQPIDPADKGFFRIRADWEVDSDGDGRFDWQEILLDGNNAFSADTDEDGLGDAEDLPDFPIIAAPTGPQRPPVAGFQHRYVSGSRWLYVAGGLASVTGSAKRSDEYEWPEDSSQVFSIINSDNFEELTNAAAGLDIESDWIPGVVSLDGINVKVYDEMGSLQSSEWTNFKCEYRLTLPENAPKGGYQIPLTFAKVHYELNGTSTAWQPASVPSGESSTLTITLTIPEGSNISAPVSVPALEVGENHRITLVPADIAILEPSGATPVDGLCVQLGGSFKLDFNGKDSVSSDCGLPDDWITWQIRRLKYDGTFENWANLVNSSNELIKGCEVEALPLPDYFGCFQVRAALANGVSIIPLQAVRMRDATNAINSLDVKNPKLAAGQPEYLGVANCDVAQRVRLGAVSWLGSTKYSNAVNLKTNESALINPSLKDTNKCNIFVTHIANSNFATTPFWYYKFLPRPPIARDDWYSDPEIHVDLDGPGWNYIGTGSPPLPGPGPLVPGMIVASHGLGTQGHCGIIDYDGAWINAGFKTVNKSIHATHSDPNYTDYRMRMRHGP